MVLRSLFLLLYFTLSCLYAEEKESPSPSQVATESEEPRVENTIDFTAELLHTLFVLGFFVLCLTVIAWLFRRMMQTRTLQLNEASLIKIIDTRAISSRSAIHILEVEGSKYLVAESHAGITLLGNL